VVASANGHGQVEYQTLAEPHRSLLAVKASKFLTTVWPVSNREEVRRKGLLCVCH